jgi:hypothetical protein
VVQVSRWDRLKDPLGVLQGVADHVADGFGAHLVLAGPSSAWSPRATPGSPPPAPTDGRTLDRCWGVWLADGFWFSTGSLARHNLAANPQITLHLKRGDQVMIVDGDDLAGDPVGCRVGEGDDPPRHVVGVAAATQRDAADLIGLDRLDGLGGQAGLRQDLGLGGSGGDRVDADPHGGRAPRPSCGSAPPRPPCSRRRGRHPAAWGGARRCWRP